MRSAPTSLETSVFTICAVAVALAPELSVASASYLIHLDLSGLARSITWGSFFAGLICWGLGTGLVFATAAAFYNRFLGSGGAEAGVRGN